MNIVFYQGETIPINISGDGKTDLRNHDFVMLVYPQYDSRNVLEFHKSDFVEEMRDGTSVLGCRISHDVTGALPAGDYAVEIVISENDGYRCVYQKTHAFTLKFSNAKKT